jgi:hypothetical protein
MIIQILDTQSGRVAIANSIRIDHKLNYQQMIDELFENLPVKYVEEVIVWPPNYINGVAPGWGGQSLQLSQWAAFNKIKTNNIRSARDGLIKNDLIINRLNRGLSDSEIIVIDENYFNLYISKSKKKSLYNCVKLGSVVVLYSNIYAPPLSQRGSDFLCKRS